jgi:hypothetical protein
MRCFCPGFGLPGFTPRRRASKPSRPDNRELSFKRPTVSTPAPRTPITFPFMSNPHQRGAESVEYTRLWTAFLPIQHASAVVKVCQGKGK